MVKAIPQIQTNPNLTRRGSGGFYLCLKSQRCDQTYGANGYIWLHLVQQLQLSQKWEKIVPELAVLPVLENWDNRCILPVCQIAK